MKKFLTALLLSGTILSSGSYARDLTPLEPAPADTTIYPNLPVSYSLRDTVKIGEYFRIGEKEENVEPSLRRTWRLLRLFDSSKTIGAPLNDFSGQTDILYCRFDPVNENFPIEGEIAGLPPERQAEVRACLDALHFKIGDDSRNDVWVTGVWSPLEGVVFLNSDTTLLTAPKEINTLSHEKTHAVQNMNGLCDDDPQWTIRDFQLNTLSIEAAAKTAENLMALELYYNGVADGPWLDRVEMDSLGTSRLLAAFKEALANNTPYAEALKRAGEVGFNAQFGHQWWLDSYNDGVLAYYTQQAVKRFLLAPKPESYSLDQVRMSGYISPSFNFTANIESLPSDDMCFGDNKRMRQAFDYADAERLGLAMGRKSRVYSEAIKKLRDDNNPFIGVDMVLVSDVLHVTDGQVTALEVMNYFAGRVSGLYPTPKTSNNLNK